MDNSPEKLPRRLRRLPRVWADRDGTISYLLTLCIEDRKHVLANEITFQRFTTFLLESPDRSDWFPRRFVLMPDHLHLIAHAGLEADNLGQWIKAMKAVVGGLVNRVPSPDATNLVGLVPLPDADDAVGPVPPPGVHTVGEPNVVEKEGPAGSGDPAYKITRRGLPVGRVPPRGDPESAPSADTQTPDRKLTRLARSWHWQTGFHDHKFRDAQSEQRKWEYVCMNPVRYGLVKRPEEWPYAGEIVYDEERGPRLIPGVPPLLEQAILMEEEGTPGQGTRPTE
jgi:hypothetical protein